MDVRYEGDAGEPNLKLTDHTERINSDSDYMGRLSTLLAWHFMDPTDDAERARNETVYALQNNRNPFIDHPEWVEAIYGPTVQLKVKQTQNQCMQIQYPSALRENMWELQTSSNLTNWNPMVITSSSIEGNWSTYSLQATNRSTFFRLRLSPIDG